MRHQFICIMRLTVLLALTGCSGEEKKYAVPSEICDVPVEKGQLEDLLPTGNELKAKKSTSGGTPPYQLCDVYIDGEIELGSEGVWRASGFTAKETAESAKVFNSRSTQSGQYAVWDDGAATVFDCKNAEQKTDRFSIRVHAVHPEGDMSEKMESFLASYAKAYKETLPCQG